MAVVTIPKNPGFFRVYGSRAGNYMVQNDKTGKNQITIPCRTLEQARALCDRLNSGDHNGQVNAPGF